MGAWSHEPFGNDDANDWANELENVTDLALIEQALDTVIEAEEYLEAPEASVAVAAAEVLAKFLGKGTQTDSYTEKIDEWVKTVSAKPSPALLAKAGQALERILGENSELRDLWEEGEGEEWVSSIAALKKAIGNK